MSNDSSTGGALLPLEDADEKAVEDVLQQIVAKTIGLDGNWVRPRWQPEEPSLPVKTQDWAAVGITVRKPDTFAYVQHHGDTDGSDEVHRQEEFELLVSLYGPNARRNSTRLIQGLSLSQNRELLSPFDIQYVSAESPLIVPELVKAQWLYRVDTTLLFRRWLSGTYAILNILSAYIKIYYETGEVTISVIPNLQLAAAEVPTGVVDGVNVTFTLLHQPNPVLSLQLFVDTGVGTTPVLQRQGEEYTLAGNVITFAVAPTAGHRLLVWYFYI